MSDIIRLLPDSVANQIAAGEVIQRPASAVKELIENAIDAGATQITLVIKNAGKTLIQVSDNGCGMSDTDARMCFERHATSKIAKAEDLFAIRTMGFRGEAMASIAAVAQVELKSRRHDAASGTHLIIEGSKFIAQEPFAGNPGTSILVKNLFFNIPARRNFLKSDASEMRHIIDEFQRTAIARPDIGFSMFADGSELFHLKPGNLRQRLTGLFGASYNERLVPVEEHTTILGLAGFIVKPEFSKKTRGEQFFFVNGRFIRDSYLHHAVTNAFESLLPAGSFPSYFLMIELDPARIDINIHPTKTEIKFDDEKSIYAILRAAVKRALGKFSVAPTLDFDQETSFNIPVSMYGAAPKAPVINIDPTYNPFRTGASPSEPGNWHAKSQEVPVRESVTKPLFQEEEQHDESGDVSVLSLLGDRYVIAKHQEELMIIERKAALERVLYENHLSKISHAAGTTQQQLFPQVIEFSAADHATLQECLEGLQHLGFDLSPLGATSYAVNGLPAEVSATEAKGLLEQMLEHYRSGSGEVKMNRDEKIARSSASAIASRTHDKMSEPAVFQLMEELFKTTQPAVTPTGKPVFIKISPAFIAKQFGN